MSKPANRYVEVSYDVGDEHSRFMAVITEANSPADAVAQATALCRRKHPDATNIEEFMQRIVSAERGAEIRKQFDDGSWEGWVFPK